MRFIAIVIPRVDIIDINIPFSEITINNFVRFNHREVNLIGVEQPLEYNEIRFYLTHPEFIIVPPFLHCPIYTVEEARKRYPFLFVDTNPLLYRRFK